MTVEFLYKVVMVTTLPNILWLYILYVCILDYYQIPNRHRSRLPPHTRPWNPRITFSHDLHMTSLFTPHTVYTCQDSTPSPSAIDHKTNFTYRSKAQNIKQFYYKNTYTVVGTCLQHKTPPPRWARAFFSPYRAFQKVPPAYRAVVLFWEKLKNLTRHRSFAHSW